MRLEGWHIVIIIVLAIVLFGAPKLPGLARSVGQSLRIFKSEVKQLKDENNTGEAGTDPVEGRVVNNPQQQPYSSTGPTAPTYQATGQPNASHPPEGQHAPQGQGDLHARGQAGPSQQSGSSHTTP